MVVVVVVWVDKVKNLDAPPGVAVVGIGARSATEVGEVVVAMGEAMTTAVEG